MSTAATTAPAESGARSSGVGALRCAACGSTEPVRSPARIHGWQRCRHCGAVIVAPWSEWEAFDGPNARTVVLERRGRVHFAVPRRTLLSGVELAAWLFIVNTIAAFAVSLLEVEPTPQGLWRWLGPLGIATAAVLLSAFFVRLWRTAQHLEISSQRMVSYRSTGARRRGWRECALTGGLELEVVDGVETVSESRFRVRLSSSGTRPVELIVPTHREAEWVAALIGRAIDPRGSDAPRCAGCGAPLRVSVGSHAEGATECCFCGAGFVVGTRAVRWPPLAIPWPPELGASPGPRDAAAVAMGRECARTSGARPPAGLRVARRAGARGRARVFELPRAPLALRAIGALALMLPTLFFAGFGAVCLWIMGAVPEGAIGTRLYLLSGAAMMFGIAAFAGFASAVQLLGREEIGIDDASLWVAQSLGPFALPSLPAAPEYRTLAPARWKASARAVPLIRLTSVEISRDGEMTRLRLATPVRSIEESWLLPGEADRWLRGELALALLERLRALGREAKRRPAEPEA